MLDKLDYCASLKNLEDLKHLLHVEFIQGDIRSVDLLNHIFKGRNIDTVMHFAAQSHVDNSFGNSFEFTKNNIEGTHALLEASRLSGTVQRFLHVSTDEVYGESSFELDDSNTEHASLLALQTRTRPQKPALRCWCWRMGDHMVCRLSYPWK